MFKILRKRKKDGKLSMKTKLTLGLGAIAAMLLLSSIISVLEYRRMSNYVSDLIAANVRSINVTQKLIAICDDYNLKLLAAIGEDYTGELPDFNRESFVATCDSLKLSPGLAASGHVADSVIYSYTAYMMTSLEFQQVMMSDFIDSRDWYFDRLQPRYNRLHSDIEKLGAVAYDALKENTLTFQASFYRGIVPGVVSVGAGLILVLLLLFFIMVYYVNPLYKMLSGVSNYENSGIKYRCNFDGNDELSALNLGISDLVEENIELKRRIKLLREEKEKYMETKSED